MGDFRKLKVWEKSKDLAVRIYKLTNQGHFIKDFRFRDQIRAAAISIPSNIAEGAGRNSNAQFKNFLQISIGSCFEVETQLIISKELEYISEEELETISKELDSIMKMNHNLQKTL